MPRKFKHISGVLLPKARRIFANSNSSPGRLADTFAHEIAHWVVHCRMGDSKNALNWISTVCGRTRTEQESWAKQIAGALLMPRSRLDVKLKRLDNLDKLDDIEIESLANDFGVSKSAMKVRIRVIQSGFEPIHTQIHNENDPSRRSGIYDDFSPEWYLDDDWNKRFQPWLPSSHIAFEKEDTVILLSEFELIDTRLVRQIHDIKSKVNQLLVASLVKPQNAAIVAELIDVDGVLLLSSKMDLEAQVTELETLLDSKVKIVSLSSDNWLQTSESIIDHDDSAVHDTNILIVEPAYAKSDEDWLNIPIKPSDIIESDELTYRRDTARIIRTEQKEGKKVVLVTGCFDILTPAHIHFLKNAREAGDVLVVGVENDNRVSLFKGNMRPVYSISERIEVLKALQCVDYTFVIFGPRSADLVPFYTQLYKTLSPDFLAVSENDPAMEDRRFEIEQAGGELKVVQTYEVGVSTTSLLKIIIAQHPSVPQVWHLPQPLLLTSKPSSTEEASAESVTEPKGPVYRQLKLPLK